MLLLDRIVAVRNKEVKITGHDKNKLFPITVPDEKDVFIQNCNQGNNIIYNHIFIVLLRCKS